jgi:adenosine deaminase
MRYGFKKRSEERQLWRILWLRCQLVSLITIWIRELILLGPCTIQYLCFLALNILHVKSFFPLFSKYIYALCNDRTSLIHTTNSVLEDFQADGVVYLELRTTPRAIPSANITKDDYVQTILGCMTNFNASSSMKTNLILSIDRRNDLPTALQVVDLAIKFRDHGVVGVDLCGDPAVGDVSIFQPAFEKAKQNNLKITIHFAEAPQSSTTKELWTLLSYQPDRIGHVIHVPDDVKEEIIKRKLGLELCLSCNVHAKMITGTYSDHHFGWWRETGCPIALSVRSSRPLLSESVLHTYADKYRPMMLVSLAAHSQMNTPLSQNTSTLTERRYASLRGEPLTPFLKARMKSRD